MKNTPVIFLAFANDRTNEDRYLRNLPLELAGIREALDQAERKGLVEIVERANITIEQLLDVFQDERYKDRVAVLHYGGHASSYQLLLEDAQGGHSMTHAEGLVSFLARQVGLQMVFLNGCSSQAQAMDLSEAGVPVVVGTSQTISDDVALKLSLRFYTGLANGMALEKAWHEATDEIKIQHGTSKKAVMMDMLVMEDDDEEVFEDQFPWNIFWADGAEAVREWNLPAAANNPLYGLPEIPQLHDLPEEPYRFLQRYERQHAELFFGRSYYIRDLYFRITDANAAPVILLYGQSGVGKSSLLDAGVLPRLEKSHQVRYARRHNQKGLIQTLCEAIGFPLHLDGETEPEPKTYVPEADTLEGSSYLEDLGRAAEKMPEEARQQVMELVSKLEKEQSSRQVQETLANALQPATSLQGLAPKLLAYWQALEESTDQPLVLILDQAEECFTQPVADQPKELEEFVALVKGLLRNPQNRPQGKLIIAYRKEYHPEIEDLFKRYTIPREYLFLKHLNRDDIVEVVGALASTERLRRKYGLELDTQLPVVVADDLLVDKESSIAPVLQILLTKMWNNAIEEDAHHPHFTETQYNNLRKQGILLQDFLHQQLDALRQSNPSWVESGLTLELLRFHTTSLGTAGTQHEEQLQALFSHHLHDLEGLLNSLKQLFLLGARGATVTGLAHDTLAPLVIQEFQESERPGQRARRILENKIKDFTQDDDILLDEADLELVEKGLTGMRALTPIEEELLEDSRKRRAALVRNRKLRRFAVIITFLVVSALAIWAVLSQQEAKREKAEALRQTDIAQDALDSAQRATQLAIQQTTIATAAKDTALAARQEALLAQKSADSARLAAEAAQRLAEAAEDSASVNFKRAQEASILANQNANEAEVQSWVARLNLFKAEFDQYLAKAREVAVQSLREQEDPALKAQLALTGYKLREHAHSHLGHMLNALDYGASRRFDTLDFPPDGTSLATFHDELKTLRAEANDVEDVPQIFNALRYAYLQAKPQQQDTVHTTEARAMLLLPDGSLVANDHEGRILQMLSAPAPQGGLPPLAVANRISEPGNLFYAIAPTSRGIITGHSNGQVVQWLKPDWQTPRPLNINQTNAVTQLVVFEEAQRLMYTVANQVWLHDMAADTNLGDYRLEQARRINAMVRIGQENMAVFASNQGGLWSITTDSVETAAPC